MAQITSGIRAILSHAAIYSFFQRLMGAHKNRPRFVADHVRPFVGMNILDVGCGPADILAYVSDVGYWGYDISHAYISQAQKRFGNRGRFHCGLLTKDALAGLPLFDVVLAMGLLHHLDDDAAQEVVQLAWQGLKPGGRLITMDPCLDPTQNPVARLLVTHDRGRNVRDKAGYELLIKRAFPTHSVNVLHQTWIPYTHCIMECEKQQLS